MFRGALKAPLAAPGRPQPEFPAVPTIAHLAEGSQVHLAAWPPHSPAPDRTALRTRDGRTREGRTLDARRREAASGRPRAKGRGAGRPAAGAALAEMAVIPETEAPRAGAMPRAAGRPPAIVRGHAAAPRAAGADGLPVAAPSRGPLNTLLAGAAAMAAARLYGPQAGVLPWAARQTPGAMQPVAVRRTPAAVPRLPARRTR